MQSKTSPLIEVGKKRAGPGRPEGSTQSREEILDAAEACFGRMGYSGTSLRDITMAAGVTQAMVNYYFGSKRELFRTVYLRRGEALSRERIDLLDAAKSVAGFQVSDIVRAYLTPAFRLQQSEQGQHYLRIQARLHAEPDEVAYQLRHEVYDVPVRLYVATLCELLPTVDERRVYIRFTEMIGIYLYILSGAHRIEQISAGRYEMPPTAEMIEEIVAFTSAGMALA